MRTLTYILFVSTLLAFGSQNMAFAKEDEEIGDSSAKDDQQIYYLYEGIDLATTLKFTYPKARVMIKSVYPQLQDENDDTSEAVMGLNNSVMDLLKSETDEFTKRVTELTPLQAKLAKNAVKNELYVDYDAAFINLDTDHLLSVRFSIEGNLTGLPHGYHHHQVINYDLETAKALTLADLFLPNSNYLQRLSDYSRKNLQLVLVNKDMLFTGTEAKSENFKNWNLKPHGLMITFDEYQVAPYISGAQTVIIPYSVLADIINPDSPIMGCVKNHTRCTRNNVLTGGFIDEAINTLHSSFDPLFSFA